MIIVRHAAEFAEENGIADVDLAIAILTQTALSRIDNDWNNALDGTLPGPSTEAAAQAFLTEIAGRSADINSQGIDGQWFTSTTEAYNNPEIFANLIFDLSQDRDTTGFDAVHSPDTITDYADFYSQYAAVGRDNEAQSSALQYASSALADKGINLIDAVTDLQTYQDAANGLVDIISSDNPFMAAVNAHLGSLQDDHTLSEAVENIEVHALLAELQGDPETANALRGQAYAEITTAMAEAGLTSGMGGVSAGVLAGKLTGKLDEIAAAHKPNADKPTTGGKTDVDSGKGADYDGAGGISRNYPDGIEPNLSIKTGQQNKHIEGTNEFNTANQSRARSTLNSDVDPQQLINQYAGTGQHVNPNKARLGEPGSVERVRTDSPIGNYVDANGVNHGPTNNFTIKYAKDGVHIVPAAP